MKVKVEYSLELEGLQARQAVRVLTCAAYLKHDDSDSKRAIADAARRYCRDWGYVGFLKACSQYPHG